MTQGDSGQLINTSPNAGLILIVEDDVAIRRVERFILEQEGFSVMEVGSGEAGLEALVDAGPALVLLDVGLPGIDGFTTCQRIRESSQVPIIMVTAQDSDEDKVRGLKLGADDYITKPFSAKELPARVEAVLRRYASGPEPGPGGLASPPSGSAGAEERGEGASQPVDEHIYEGAVRLVVEAPGSVRKMIHFVDELRESPEFWFQRLSAEQQGEGVDILLRLRRPLELKTSILQMEGVSSVESPVEAELDLSERLLHVTL